MTNEIYTLAMKLAEMRLEKAIKEASEAFWQSVSESFPDVKSGDLSPTDSHTFEKASKEAILSWLKGNS